VKIAHDPGELERRPRAVAIGTFDGVHLGHRAVIRAAVDAAASPARPGQSDPRHGDTVQTAVVRGDTVQGDAVQGDAVHGDTVHGGAAATDPESGRRTPTVLTFHPHPRTALGGNRVALLSTLERRLELLEASGVEEVLVVEFTGEFAALEPDEFASDYLSAIGAEVVVAGTGFRFGRRRSGDLDVLRDLGFDARPVPLVEGVSSTRIRQLAWAGHVEEAARLLGRPLEVDGTVVTGEHRGGTLGFPTANLLVDPELLVPEFGIYAGAVGDRRAAISIGVNPHYGGTERRIEAYLLDWSGDLYGDRLVVELWRRLREERAFANEAELVDQIARDVDETRAATRPVE
jgi:riboflavin kinase/FMN adenylyltransferase